jgi:hypothetical protein
LYAFKTSTQADNNQSFGPKVPQRVKGEHANLNRKFVLARIQFTQFATFTTDAIEYMTKFCFWTPNTPKYQNNNDSSEMTMVPKCLRKKIFCNFL